MRILFWAGILFVIAGAAIYGDTYYDLGRLNWTPLSVPVSLAPGKIRTSEFRLVHNIPYDVELSFDRGKIDSQRLGCLSGSDIEPETDCQNTPSVVDLSWVISRAGQVVATGSSSPSEGGNQFERLLGGFRPNDDGRYTLSAEIQQDASALNVANPRLQVVIDLWKRDDIAMGEGFGGLLAGGVIIVGLILIALAAMTYLRRRKRDVRTTRASSP
jgi:hypothetical protein